MNIWFKLDENKKVVPATREEGAAQFENPEQRIVEKTKVGIYEVSTVFLGLDHGFGGPKLFFETMIFGKGPADGYQERFATWDQAVAGHKEACAYAKKGLK